VRRSFVPDYDPTGTRLIGCSTIAAAYRLDQQNRDLLPVDSFHFPVEVYEQGRVSRLRDDLARQLEMLDEFANLSAHKNLRDELATDLRSIAQQLRPLLEENENLRQRLATLPGLQAELTEKEKLIPDQADAQSWARAEAVKRRLDATVSNLVASASELSEHHKAESGSDILMRFFYPAVPVLTSEEVAERPLLERWVQALAASREVLELTAQAILEEIAQLQARTDQFMSEWKIAWDRRQASQSDQLRLAGVESPAEIVARVDSLRFQVALLEGEATDRLAEVTAKIDQLTAQRNEILTSIRAIDDDIRETRRVKAEELTQALGGDIQISLAPRGDRSGYRKLLADLIATIVTRDSKIHNRETQLESIVDAISPTDLARALAHNGLVERPDADPVRLSTLCCVTENTEKVLCRIADDITKLTEIELVEVPDIPQILVRRRGEAQLADLRSGLSPGEQSAAILTLALHTRSMPLILDQPEDELGYSYVVHLIVPKILQSRFSRQLLVVTHNANIPVLGDADYVIKMENKPRDPDGRICSVASEGTFENPEVTRALLELEGGRRAFEFRQQRYSLPL
jgi:hypothetical protein